MNNIDSLMSRVVVGAMAALVPTTALAQAPAPPPEAPPAEAAPPPEEAAPAPPPVEAAPPPPPMEAAPPPEMPAPPPEEAAPPPPVEEEKKEEAFTITTGIGFRSALRFQDLDNPKKLGRPWFDELNVEPRFSGKVTDVVGWTANLTVSGRTPDSVVVLDEDGNPVSTGPGPIKFQAQALDLVGQLDFADEFHVWLGRMLTPSDRSNFSGAWFMSPWNYTGVYPDAYVGPRGTEEVGREVGAVIWGHDKAGKFKYYAGVMDLDNPELTPLFSGRLAYAIIGDEPGFYSSSTYYGTKDILAIGVAGQYQKRSVVGVDEKLTEFNADILAEFNLDGAGTVTGEAGYYHFDGPVFPVEDAYYVLASYLTPDPVGIGNIQVLARLQQTMNDDRTAIEGVVSYVMKEYFAKLALSFTHFNLPNDQKANWLQLGFQIQQ